MDEFAMTMSESCSSAPPESDGRSPESPPEECPLQQLLQKRNRRVAELELELAELHKELKRVKSARASEKSAAAPSPCTPCNDAPAPQRLSDDEVAAKKERLYDTARKILRLQMIYKPGMKHSEGKGKRVSVNLPGVPEQVAAAMVGAENWTAKPSAKVVKPKAPVDLQVDDKALRYGSSLSIPDGSLKATWTREDGLLKIAGLFYFIK